MESLIDKYAIRIVWSDRDDGYIATCPEFPGLSAFGETAETALHEARVAIDLFIKTYEEDGLPIPEPQGVQEYSGQFRLRIPPNLHAQAARLAEESKTSLNQFILNAVAEFVGGRKTESKVLQDIKRLVFDLKQSAVLNTWSSFPPVSVDYKQTVTTEAHINQTTFNVPISKSERGN